MVRRARRRLLHACVPVGAMLGLPARAWTGRNGSSVRLLVPAPAGGTMDIVARLLAEQLAAEPGSPAIVENRPGGGGVIAIQALLQAPPDGRTLMVTTSNVLTEIPHVVRTPYDPLKDVRPIASIARATLVMVAAPSFPPSDLKGVVDHAKSRGGQLSFASYSAGTASQYAGTILGRRTGVDMVHVPFAGSPPALQQVMGGHVPVMFDGMPTSLPLIRSNRIKPIAVASPTRSPFLPEVPTFAELGYPEMDFGNWVGVVGSAKLPEPLVDGIGAVVVKAAAAPGFRDRLSSAGFEVGAPQTSEALSEATRAESDRNAAIVRRFDIRL